MTVSVFALTDDGDLDVSSGNLAIESEPAAVGVIFLRKAYSLFQGSWFLDTTVGFPWLQNVLGAKPGDLTGLAGLFRATAMTCPGAVSAALDVSYDGATRALSVAFDVALSDGSNAEGTVTV